MKMQRLPASAEYWNEASFDSRWGVPRMPAARVLVGAVALNMGMDCEQTANEKSRKP